MTFLSRMFRRDGHSSKKHAKQNGVAAPEPSKPQWTDPLLRTEVKPDEVQELLHGCTVELKARALDTPFLLLPFRPTSDPSAARTFVRHYFQPSTENRASLRGEYLLQELRLTEPMVLCSVMKWCWSRLPGGVVTWDAYELFKVGEQDSQFARDAFSTFIPISADSDARTKIIFDFFDLMAAIAAHGKSNGLGGRKLSRYAGWWAFEHVDTGNGFESSYKAWSSAADAASHLFFAYLRSQSPESLRGTTGITALPISLQALVQATEYPPEPPSLLRIQTTKVVMVVNTVSPTPFALLRRARNFEYRDSDYALQEFSNKDDPVQALTDECRRVLRCISSTNQSEVPTTTKASTSLRDTSWSRFEDIGFGPTIEEFEEDVNGASPAANKEGGNGHAKEPLSLKSAPNSGTADLGRPTTPSWADFLSSGFTDEGETKARPEFLLPPDKILPPIQTAPRGQSSHSHKRVNFDQDFSAMEPGELASITELELDDAFWWVWVSSLAGEETSARKAVFGRCALIETILAGGKWLILEEQVKGAAPEPEAGAYIAEKKSFFGFRTKRGGLLTRRKTSAKKSSAAEAPPYKAPHSAAQTSKSSIGPDQHARIQAAAAELQRKHREQEAEQEEEGRWGRDDAMSKKTNSVLTLQPSIMSEASQAMKWANNYDKDAVRAAYLSNSRAGTGAPAGILDLDVSGHDRDESPKKPAAQEEGKPAPSKGDVSPSAPAAPSVVPAPLPSETGKDVASVKKATEPALAPTEVKESKEQKDAKDKKDTKGKDTSKEKGSKEKDTKKDTKEKDTKEKDTKKDTKEKKITKEKKDSKDKKDKSVAAGKQKETSETSPAAAAAAADAPAEATSEPAAEAAPKKSSESTEEHKKLKKKPGNTGLKGMFGKKKAEPSSKAQPEARSTVAATKAAIESRAAESSKDTKSQPSGTTSATKKTMPPAEPKAAGSSAPATAPPISPPAPAPAPAPAAPAAPVPESPQGAAEPAMEPSMALPPSSADGPPRTDREEEFDNLSRVDTNEQEQAEREFATFDHQSPIVDQPAFVPEDSPAKETFRDDPTPPPIKKASPSPPSPPPAAMSSATTYPGESEPHSGERTTPSQELTAEKPQKTAEPEAAKTEASPQNTESSTPPKRPAVGGGPPSGSEPIEARAARIRARVAELTKNMDSK